MLTLYLLPFVLLFCLPIPAWLALFFVAIMGVGKAGIGMCIMHDGLHGAYSSKKWINRLTGWSMYLIGSNVFNWKIQHNIHHHAYTNIKGLDEDIQTRWIIRLCEYTPLHPIHRFQHIYAFFLYGLMTLSMLFGDISQLVGYNQSGITQKYSNHPKLELFKALLVKLIYLLVMLGLPLFFLEYHWYQVIAGFLLMHLIAGFILSLVFQMAHIAEGTIQSEDNKHILTGNDWAVHQLLTTSDFAVNNNLLSWYAGGLNFQVVHHLFPNICHVHYRTIASIVAQTAAEFGVPYHVKPYLGEALRSHVNRLKELGRPSQY